LLGVLACLLITGTAMLDPGNVRWLTHSDLAQSYLGWAFYRRAPWGWPPGANPLYGAGLHSSIYYSDSIPLLAMLLKPLAAWLPQPFQYFGLWVLLCFVLQGWFAWRLLAVATQSRLVQCLGILFFLFAPPMLMRLGGHMALVGQWIVLAAVYLCVRPERKRQALYWALLLAVAMMVHAYLFAMAGAVWLADAAQRHLTCAQYPFSARLRALAPELLGMAAVAACAAWMAGLFAVSGAGAQADGFGYYKMNLLAPINGAGWSRLGLNFPQAAGEYEGFNYLGMGGLALVLAALAIVVISRAPRAQRLPGPLLWMAVLLAVAAITCNIGIGSLQWPVPLPGKWRASLSHLPLQSTGRLFWVGYYVALLAALWVLLQTRSVARQITVLTVVLLLQGLDLAPAFFNLHAMLSARAREPVPGLRGPFWGAAGRRYATLSVVPLSKPQDWERLAFYANGQGMGFDGVQLARMDMDKFFALYNEQQVALLSNRLDARTLYLLDDRELPVARAIPKQQAALFRLDGENVLAPGWVGPLPASAIDLRATPSAAFDLPFHSDFAPASNGRLLLGDGWDATAVTSLSDAASLFVPGGLDTSRPLTVRISLHRANVGKSMAMELEAWFDGRRIGHCSMADGECASWTLEVPGTRGDSYFRRLNLRPATPKAKLRIALDAISVR
jgi:hypothetical protein